MTADGVRRDLARLLRGVADRLDPPAPLTHPFHIHVDGPVVVDAVLKHNRPKGPA